MKVFLQVFIFCSFMLSVACGDEFRDMQTIVLKKDEVKKILVKYDKITKLFKFRWTTYKNKGLIIHRSYDRIVAQNILYLRHPNQTFRLELRPRGADCYNVAYILVKFKEFNYEKNEAIFEMFLSDKKMDVKLKYLKNS